MATEKLTPKDCLSLLTEKQKKCLNISHEVVSTANFYVSVVMKIMIGNAEMVQDLLSKTFQPKELDFPSVVFLSKKTLLILRSLSKLTLNDSKLL